MFGSISTCSSRAFQRYHPRVCQLPSWHPNLESGVQNHVRPPLLTATLCPDRGTAEPCGGDGARPQGWYETNDTDDDPLNDTPHPRVRVENSFAGFSKEVRICLVAGIGDAPPPAPRNIDNMAPPVDISGKSEITERFRPLFITPQEIAKGTPALLLKRNTGMLLFDLARDT